MSKKEQLICTAAKSDPLRFHDAMHNMYKQYVLLYHRSHLENVESILKLGLLIDKTDCGFIHTVFGDSSINRISGRAAIFELKILSTDYDRLYPEENTYDDGLGCDGDERGIILERIYLDSHPDFIGGDICVYKDIPPSALKRIG